MSGAGGAGPGRMSVDLSRSGCRRPSRRSRWSATTWPTTAGTAAWRQSSPSTMTSWTFAGCPGDCTYSPRCSAFRASPARAPLRSCRSRTHWPTALELRRWRPGSSAGRTPCPRCNRCGRASCPGEPPRRLVPIAGWCATPAQGYWHRGLGPGPCCARMRVRTAPARCARWCDTARSCPVPRSRWACWPPCPRHYPVCSAMRPIRWVPRCRWQNRCATGA